MTPRRPDVLLLGACLLAWSPGCADRPDPRVAGGRIPVRVAPDVARALREPAGAEAPVGTFRLVVEGLAGLSKEVRSGHVVLERKGAAGAPKGTFVRKFSLFPEGAEPMTIVFDVTDWVGALPRDAASGPPELTVRVTASAPSTAETPAPDAFRAASARLEYVAPHR